MEKKIGTTIDIVFVYRYIKVGVNEMKKTLYILSLAACLSFSIGASYPNNNPAALDWYGYSSLLTVDMFSGNTLPVDGDNDVQRKRRHRRRRKICPSNGKKGW